MKYINKLNDEELTELFKLFMATDEEFVSLEIDRYDFFISLNGIVRIPDDENDGDMIAVEDNYDISDYNVKVYSHSGNVTKDYRKYMYKKFGYKYAKDYLLN